MNVRRASNYVSDKVEDNVLFLFSFISSIFYVPYITNSFFVIRIRLRRSDMLDSLRSDALWKAQKKIDKKALSTSVKI
jgi:hypothetical protein